MSDFIENDEYHDAIDDNNDNNITDDIDNITIKSLKKAIEEKLNGNNYYKKKDFNRAILFYTKAIKYCPDYERYSIDEDYIHSDDEEEEEEGGNNNNNNNNNNNEEIKNEEINENSINSKSSINNNNENNKNNNNEEESDDQPSLIANEQLSIFYANRGACFLAIEDWLNCVYDCNESLKRNERYIKALMRRSVALEKLDKLEDSLKDINKILEIDPSLTPKYYHKKIELERKVKERFEKLKDETLGKLKDLGNSILGNFGLSTDNFNFQQDENGSYNISFQK